MEKVTFKFFDEQLEYARDSFDAAGLALFFVNEHLKEKGINIEFDYTKVFEGDIAEPYGENCKEVSYE